MSKKRVDSDGGLPDINVSIGSFRYTMRLWLLETGCMHGRELVLDRALLFDVDLFDVVWRQLSHPMLVRRQALPSRIMLLDYQRP